MYNIFPIFLFSNVYIYILLCLGHPGESVQLLGTSDSFLQLDNGHSNFKCRTISFFCLVRHYTPGSILYYTNIDSNLDITDTGLTFFIKPTSIISFDKLGLRMGTQEMHASVPNYKWNQVGFTCRIDPDIGIIL